MKTLLLCLICLQSTSFHPVKFTSELAEMERAGYENFIELGPNKVLTGLVKKTLKGKNAVNIENNATMEKALASLS